MADNCYKHPEINFINFSNVRRSLETMGNYHVLYNNNVIFFLSIIMRVSIANRLRNTIWEELQLQKFVTFIKQMNIIHTYEYDTSLSSH